MFKLQIEPSFWKIYINYAEDCSCIVNSYILLYFREIITVNITVNKNFNFFLIFLPATIFVKVCRI